MATPQTFENKHICVHLLWLPASNEKVPSDEIFRMHGRATSVLSNEKSYTAMFWFFLYNSSALIILDITLNLV